MQRHYVAFGAREHGPYSVNGVCRVGNQGYVTGVQKTESGVADPLFGANERQHFLVGV